MDPCMAHASDENTVKTAHMRNLNWVFADLKSRHVDFFRLDSLL